MHSRKKTYFFSDTICKRNLYYYVKILTTLRAGCRLLFLFLTTLQFRINEGLKGFIVKARLSHTTAAE
jgi:hypothetical protein